MKAIILAAGLGNRLGELTKNIPKPMIKYKNKPILEHNINLCKKYGITDIYINLHYYPDVIMDYFGNGEKFGVNIYYNIEKNLLGTAGGVKSIFNKFNFDEPFYILYGDNYSDFNLNLLKTNSMGKIAFHYRENISHSGVAEFDKNDIIIKFIEKPKTNDTNSHWVNSGIYYFHPDIINHIPNGFCDFSNDLFPKLLNSKIILYGVKSENDVKSFDTIDMVNNNCINLKNKIYIVTGGSTGIGYEITKKLLKQNSTVIICSRNKKKLKSSTKKLKNISRNIHYYKIDITKIKKVKKFSKWIIKKFNHIDGLINNSGILGPIGKTTNLKIKDIKNTIDTNLFGTINMIYTFYPLFNKNNRKKIINLSGGGSTSPLKNYTSYAISKTSVVRLTENLSKELNDTDINAISPGFISTKIHDNTLKLSPNIVGEEYYKKTLDMVNKGGESVNKTTDLILFLLSNKSNNITGKLISSIWDNWDSEKIINKFKTDEDFATIRRIDEKYFYKK